MTQDEKTGTPGIEHFLALETRVWAALVQGDPQADGAMLSPKFLGVYETGFADRASHMEQLAGGPVMAAYDLDQARLLPLGRDRALLCYRAIYTRAGAVGREVMFISSLWERDGDRWLNIFSQDTPATLP